MYPTNGIESHREFGWHDARIGFAPAAPVCFRAPTEIAPYLQSKVQNPKSKISPRTKGPVWTRFLYSLLTIALFSGCDAAIIQGKVFDSRGETLPGVSVLTEGTPYEALTNGRGEYAVRFVPKEEFHVKFFKTGYTTGDLLIRDVLEARPVTATAISLIKLPEGPGVYLSDERYSAYERAASDTPVELRRMSDESTVFGTYRQPRETLDRSPFIVVYRGFTIPRYGIKMNRLEETEVKPPEGVSGREGVKAWVRSGEIPVDVSVVDVGQAQLLRIAYVGELGLGGYAVHWGALDGDKTAEEERLFCFRIVEKLTPPEGTVDGAEEGAPDEAAKKGATPKADRDAVGQVDDAEL